MTKDEWYAQLFERLGNSKFRSSFHLKQADKEYVREKGIEKHKKEAKKRPKHTSAETVSRVFTRTL